MDTRDTVFLICVLFFGKLLIAKTVSGDNHFEIDTNYNDAYCSDESDVHGRVLSDSSCAYKCSRTEGCNGFFYNIGTRICSTVKKVPTTANECETQAESVFYKKACASYLVSGPPGVEDSQLTQSAYYCEDWPRIYCKNDPPFATSAKYARLNSTGMHTGAWSAPDHTTEDDYVQVDFWHVKTIAAVAIQGRHNDNYGFDDQYVTSFKVRTSVDCQQFTAVPDNKDPEKVNQNLHRRNGATFLGVRIFDAIWRHVKTLYSAYLTEPPRPVQSLFDTCQKKLSQGVSESTQSRSQEYTNHYASM